MMDNILIYRNELKNKIVANYKLIGISSEVILSFAIFKKNDELEKFVLDIFDTQFRPYVFKSRTLLVSRVIRIINSNDEKQNTICKNRLYKFLSGLIDDDK